MLQQTEARLNAGDDVRRAASDPLRLFSGRAHMSGWHVWFAQGVSRSLQLDSGQDVSGNWRVSIEELRHVVAGELDNVQFHREGNTRAIGRPRKRIAVPGLWLVLHGDILVAVALLEVLDEALRQDAVAPARFLIEDIVDVGDEDNEAVRVHVLHVPGARHRHGFSQAGLSEALVPILLPFVPSGLFAPDRCAELIAEDVAFIVGHLLVRFHVAYRAKSLGFGIRILEVGACDIVGHAAQLRVLGHPFAQLRAVRSGAGHRALVRVVLLVAPR